VFAGEDKGGLSIWRMDESGALDVSDYLRPKLIESFNLPGNPGRVIVHQGRLVVPNGYEGLWAAREPE